MPVEAILEFNISSLLGYQGIRMRDIRTSADQAN